jgi:type IV pilus assembly protein PilO
MKFLNDIRNLDRNNVGGWPQSVKMFFTGLLFAVIVLIGWYFFIGDQQDSLTTLAGKEDQLKQEFSTKQAKAVNLEALQQQLDEMQDMLRQLLRQLPGKTEMPELLVDISQTAQSAGLQTELFQPGPETPKDFYAEKPITLRMTGTYHQFGTFISGVASLPRVVILTLHDVSLTPKAASKGGVASDGQLVLQGTVKTYRYLDDEESAPPSRHRATQAGRAEMKRFAAINPLRVVHVVLMLGLALVLSGCTRGTSDLRDWIAQEKAKKGAPITPLPVIKTFETFKYDDQDKRDPFSPSLAETEPSSGNSGPRPDANRAKEPLEMFSLDSLKMVGTLGSGSRYRSAYQGSGWSDPSYPQR